MQISNNRNIKAKLTRLVMTSETSPETSQIEFWSHEGQHPRDNVSNNNSDSLRCLALQHHHKLYSGQNYGVNNP